jgi:hypothetical protein
MTKFKPLKSFYLIVVDEDRGEFSVEGPMSDDTSWNFRVCAAQGKNRRVRCSTATNPTREEAIAEWQRTYGGKLVPPESIV